MTIAQLFDEQIKPLPPCDRLELARLILQSIPHQSVVDYGTEWSEEDLSDAAAHSLRRASESFEE